MTACAWQYEPLRAGVPGTLCGAVATHVVRYRVDQRVVAYCLNHAQREVQGGQAAWGPPRELRDYMEGEDAT